MRMIKWGYQRIAMGLSKVGTNFLAAFVGWIVVDDCGTVRSGCVSLKSWGIVRHDSCGRDVEEFATQRNSLSMVA